MKRMILFVFLILVVLLSVSCKIASHAPFDETTGLTGLTNLPIHDDINIQSVDEYEAFLKSETLREDFISYNRLRFLGDFEQFVISEFYSGYEYHFSNTFGSYTLVIRHDKELKIGEDEKTLANQPNDDLRQTSDGETGWYCMTEDLRYCYGIQGKLGMLAWKSHDVTFELFSSHDFSSVPNDGSLVSRLLNKNTALEAKAEFEAMVFGEE